MINKSRTRNSLLRKLSLRKSRARKSRARKSRARKSRARKSPKRSLRKSRALKSPIRKRSLRKSRARKSPIRKRSLRKSRARKSPKRSLRKSRALKSPIRKRSVRKSTRRKSHSRVGKSVRRKSAHKSPRKSVRYKYARNYSPSHQELKEQELKEWVKEKFENKKLYRCISLGELEFIKRKGYMSSLSIKPNRRQDVSVAKWILHHIASQYSSTGRIYSELIDHSFCGEGPKKKSNTKEKPICTIRIDLSQLDNYEIIIPSETYVIVNGKKVKREQHTEQNLKVYTEFDNINDETQGINVYDYDYSKELDENGHLVEKRVFVKHTNDTVYLYPAFSKEGDHRILINRWTSGLNLGFSNDSAMTAAATVGEVVFCGNIPSKALTVVAGRIKGTMTTLPKAVKIEEYTPPHPPPDSDDKMATSLDPDHPPDSDDKMATSLPDSRKRKHNEDTDSMPPPERRPRKIEEYVDIYDEKGNKLSTVIKHSKKFLDYLNDGVIKIQKVNGVDKYVVVVDFTHDIYNKIAKQNQKNMFKESEKDLRRNTNFKKLSVKEFLDTLPDENIDIYDIHDNKLDTMNKHDEKFEKYLETKAIRFIGTKFVFIPTKEKPS